MPKKPVYDDLESNSDTANIKILIAEDDPVNLEVLSYRLDQAGYTVSSVSNGKEVLEALEKKPFDIILMDVQMPEMDGLTATQKIRVSKSGKFNPNIPIIALTAYALKEDKERFHQAGIDDYLTKPVELNYLTTLIDKALSLKKEKKSSTKKLPVDNFILEIDAFMEIFKDDPDVLSDIKKKFLDNAGTAMETLKSAVENKNLETIAEIAHKITNYLSAIQIRSLLATSRNLENSARVENSDSFIKLYDELKLNMDKLIDHIKTQNVNNS